MLRWQGVNGIYQIYPRSFVDSSGDGVGDLAGISSRLDYLKGRPDSLGIDAIWLSPFFTSPMRDFGYDISDYRSVDPIFGELADFDNLIHEAHKRNIKVVIDFVPNHTSSDHVWFQEALNDPSSEKRSYYIFRQGKPDGSPPNNWLSVFGGSAWEPVPSEPGVYYLHSFLKDQPDLDWSHPGVQEEMRSVLRFWLDRGVDGFRADAVRWMAKDLRLLDEPENDRFHEAKDPFHRLQHIYSRASEPELGQYLTVITSVVREYEERMIVFEDNIDEYADIASQIEQTSSVAPDVAAPFNLQAIHLPLSARAFAGMITGYQKTLPMGARSFYAFSNHDESRLASRVGDKPARMLAVLQMMLPGVPTVYYGQELGMRDGDIPADKVQDPFELRVPGMGLGRDPERTPMLWTGDDNAGFSESAQTWLPINSRRPGDDVVSQQQDSTSSLMLYRSLLALRSAYGVLRSPDYQTVFISDELFVFRRFSGGEDFLVVLNFSPEEQSYFVDHQFRAILSAQGHDYGGQLRFVQPYDGIVLQRSR